MSSIATQNSKPTTTRADIARRVTASLADRGDYGPDRPYIMPPIEIGDRVLYGHVDGSGDKALAFVTSVNDNSVNLKLITEGINSLVPRSGVRHRSDPSVRRRLEDESSDGVWEYTPRHLEMIRLAADVEALLAAMPSNRATK